jgi:hypothetical protein
MKSVTPVIHSKIIALPLNHPDPVFTLLQLLIGYHDAIMPLVFIACRLQIKSGWAPGHEMISRVLEILHLVVPISEWVVVIWCNHLRVLCTVGAQVLFYCNVVFVGTGSSSSFVESLTRSVEAQASSTLAQVVRIETHILRI